MYFFEKLFVCVSGCLWRPFALDVMLILVMLRATPSAAGPLWLLVVAIRGAWCFQFGTFLALRKHDGGPWEHQDGHERVRNRISWDLGRILEPYFESLLGLEA